MNKEAYFKHKDMMEAYYKLDKESIWVKSDKWRLIHRPSFDCHTTIYALADDYSDIRKAAIDGAGISLDEDLQFSTDRISRIGYYNFKFCRERYTIVEKKDFTPWTPTDGEKAWYIDGFSPIDSANNWNYTDTSDRQIINLGLVFKTKENAEAKIAYMKAKYKVEQEIARLNEGWKPDFGASDLCNYCIELREDCLTIDGTYTHKAQDTSMYIKSIQKAKKLIKSHKEDLLIILRY